VLPALHVIFGTVALLVVPAALVARKGSDWHKRWGTAFTASMTVVLCTAGFMWQAKGHLFLVPLGLVSAYLIFNGWRVIARRRRPEPVLFEDRIDRAAALGVIAAGCATAFLGLTAASPLMLSIRPALFGIGSIAICFGLNDILGFYAPRSRTGWLLAHLSAMLAAYISATTAFLVINAHSVPMVLRWALPSAIGAATIVAYSIRVLGPALSAARLRLWPAGQVSPAGATRSRASAAARSAEPSKPRRSAAS